MLSLVLVFVMLLSLLPMAAFAAEAGFENFKKVNEYKPDTFTDVSKDNSVMVSVSGDTDGEGVADNELIQPFRMDGESGEQPIVPNPLPILKPEIVDLVAYDGYVETAIFDVPADGGTLVAATPMTRLVNC